MLQTFARAHSHSVEITEIYILTFFEKFRASNVNVQLFQSVEI